MPKADDKADDKARPQGRELAAIRRRAKAIEKAGLELSAQVLRVIYGENHKHTVREVRVYPNNMKLAIVAGGLNPKNWKVVGVYEDPPGICREPRKGEKF